MGVASATTAVVFQIHAGKTGPMYHQRQAGPERNDVAACTSADLRQYVEDVMNPGGQRRVHQITDRQRLELGVVLDESTQLGLLVILLVEQVEPGRRDVTVGESGWKPTITVVRWKMERGRSVYRKKPIGEI